jgi:hypothetical protein
VADEPDGATVDLDVERACGWRSKAGTEPQQRCLAGAVAAGDERKPLQLEVDVLEDAWRRSACRDRER